MSEMLKIAAAAVTAAVCAVVVRKQAPEIALLLAIAAGALLLWPALSALGTAYSVLDMLSEQIGLSQTVLEPVLKIAGISVLTRVSAEICRDAKESGIAAGVETAGAALALVTALPLLEAVMSTLRQLL